ncbi:MAG: restriction endonuclease subunit S [Pasteurellaceae bacterium]|nr:restriction endonuclease subunit S [Pasteurellaceae bacterium]
MKLNNIFQIIEQAEVEWKPLGEVATLYGGLTGKSKNDFESGNAKYITYKNIFGNLEIDCTTLESVKISENEKQHCVQYGDVLFTGSSEISEEAGMSAAVTTHFDEPIYLNSFSFGIRFNEDIDIAPEFAKFLFRSNFMRKQIIKTASGVTRFNISKEQFKKIQIPIPPISLQKEIVNILDKLTELKATLKAELSLREKQYQYYRDYLLTFGDDVEWKTLKDVALDFGRGKSKHRPRNDVRLYGGDIPFIQTGDIRNSSHLIEDYSQTYSDFGLQQSKLWKKGTLCITIAANIAETGILNFDACFPDSIIGFVADPKQTSEAYVEYLLSSFKTKLQSQSTGSAQENINLATFDNLLLPFPPLESQQKIVAILDKFERLTHSITEGLPKEIELREKQYQYYRDKLLNFNKNKM